MFSICTITAFASSSEYFPPLESILSRSSPPSHNSITM
uniref:Uncharacterized protein n=1 Tax=Rhizophora mucronata TaxID=61149 RepID=A0A2P2P388_RHIMU